MTVSRQQRSSRRVFGASARAEPGRAESKSLLTFYDRKRKRAALPARFAKRGRIGRRLYGLISWPGTWFDLARPGVTRNAWHGTLLEDKQDAAGTLYRRNRSYDPRTGQFTQEDPIGLAGGLNVYGFAAGDPVSYSDPYGLNPCTVPNFDAQACAKQAAFAMLDGAVQGLGMITDVFGIRGAGEAATGIDSRTGGRLDAGQRVTRGGIDVALAAPIVRVGRLGAQGRALLRARPVGNALKSDAHHRAASFVRGRAARIGTHFPIVGGDGATRTLTQVSGEMNGVAGRFEYIVDQAGDLTHQRFVAGGGITGVPNIP